MCTKITALGDVSRDQHSTLPRAVFYLSTRPLVPAVFSVQTRGSALSNIYESIIVSIPIVT